MRAAFLFLLLVSFGTIAKGQTGPVFQYTHPSKETLKAYALEETARGAVYRKYLVDQINFALRDTTIRVSERNVEDIFNYLFLEEVYLQEGMFTNSGYNPASRKMVPSLGHKWNGFCWIFRIGTYSIPLIKEDCGNILIVTPLRRIIQTPIIPENRQYTVDPNQFRSQGEFVYNSPKKLEIDLGNLSPEPTPVVFGKKKDHTLLWIAGIVTTAGITYLLMRDKGGPVGAPSYDAGGPAGAPSYPANTGGPGGAGGYGFARPNFNPQVGLVFHF